MRPLSVLALGFIIPTFVAGARMPLTLNTMLGVVLFKFGQGNQAVFIKISQQELLQALSIDALYHVVDDDRPALVFAAVVTGQ